MFLRSGNEPEPCVSAGGAAFGEDFLSLTISELTGWIAIENANSGPKIKESRRMSMSGSNLNNFVNKYV